MLSNFVEAMTKALIRLCPKCSEPYIKESGCNKISCPSCRTLSCFICGKVVSGYAHFTGAGVNSTHQEPGAACALWDDSAARTFAEVSDPLAFRIPPLSSVVLTQFPRNSGRGSSY